jgi:RimJ/RimL family protein N-acetyltransferase
MGSGASMWVERWRRYGPLGFVTKTALKLGERTLGLNLEAQYTAPLDSVLAALDGVRNLEDDVAIRVLKGRKKRLPMVSRFQALQHDFAPSSLLDYDRIAIAEKGGQLIGYWCFTLREGNLYERGVFVSEATRGKQVAARLLYHTVFSMNEAEQRGRLLATSDLFNRASRRMLERCGLQLDGLMTRGRFPLMGEFHLMWKPPG